MLCRCKYLKRLNDKKNAETPTKLVYLDNCATTPVDPRVIGAMETACRKTWGNPSSIHLAGLEAAKLLDKCRIDVGTFLDCPPEKVYFCGSATDALFTVIKGFNPKKFHFITTAIEHSAIISPLLHLKNKGHNVDFLKVDSNGQICISEFEKLLKHKDAVFFYSPINHETGSIQSIREIYQLKKNYNVTIVMDAVQAVTRLTTEKWQPYYDIIVLGSHKFYAPKGTGLFAIKNKTSKLHKFRSGSKQEDGYFPGTQNIPGITACAEAIKLLSNDEISRLKILHTEGLKILQNEVPQFAVNTPSNSQTGILNISLMGKNVNLMEKLILTMAEEQICVSRFSACNGKIKIPSQILKEMGFSYERAMTSLRISCGRFNSRDDFFRLARFLKIWQNKLIQL
ncbi:MAG: aminotransferase class V-fold PLP-dependent enzyme [Spirochaetales bacterium]|nr:aminotransferase class V-fold PLP-dependent enzyme [Spirochaetales bacterium]